MRILEWVQAFLPLLIIEILLFFLFSKFKWGKNDCTNSRVRIVIYYYSHIQVLHSIGLFRYQGPQEKLKRPTKIQMPYQGSFYRNFIIFLSYVNRFDIRIQAIKAHNCLIYSKIAQARIKLFRGLVIGFGHKGRLGRICNSVH